MKPERKEVLDDPQPNGRTSLLNSEIGRKRNRRRRRRKRRRKERR
jgi:hypothetical protein